MLLYRLPVALLPLIIYANVVYASVGDRSPAYQRCINECKTKCSTNSSQGWTLWPCHDECSYQCLTSLTDAPLSFSPKSHIDKRMNGPGSELEGLPLGQQVQFHGKWPFHRLPSAGPLKFQEPLSVLFSIGNFYAHYKGWIQLGQLGATSSLRGFYRFYALTGMNTWIWSSVFHTRDVPWTEKADYFSAAGAMLAGLWIAGIRLTGLYSSQNSVNLTTRKKLSAGKNSLLKIWSFCCLSVFLGHCVYLARGERFDYGYNMKFNVTIALITIFMWAGWTLFHILYLKRNSPSRFAPHAHLPLLPLVLLPALTASELLDFAPVGIFGLRLLDAHALWHASTISVVGLWYKFLLKDLSWIEGLDPQHNGQTSFSSENRRRLE